MELTKWAACLILLCTVYADVRTTHFTLQNTGVPKLQRKLACNKIPLINCAIKCTHYPYCVWFGHVGQQGRQKTWFKTVRTPSFQSAMNQSRNKPTSRRRIRTQGETEKCPGLRHLDHGTWRFLRKTSSNMQIVTAHCFEGFTLFGHQEVTCNMATNRKPKMDVQCRQDTWTYLNNSRRSINRIVLPSLLKYLSRIFIGGIFNHTLTLYLHNSRMPSYKARFILKGKSVDISLFWKGQSNAPFLMPLTLDAPKQGHHFSLDIWNENARLMYKLSRGKRLCPFPVPGFVEGVDRIMVHNDSSVKKVRAYVKERHG